MRNICRACISCLLVLVCLFAAFTPSDFGVQVLHNEAYTEQQDADDAPVLFVRHTQVVHRVLKLLLPFFVIFRLYTRGLTNLVPIRAKAASLPVRKPFFHPSLPRMDASNAH